MAKSHHSKSRFKMSRDVSADRRLHQKLYRSCCKQLMREGDWDSVAPRKKTCGWLSW